MALKVQALNYAQALWSSTQNSTKIVVPSALTALLVFKALRGDFNPAQKANTDSSSPSARAGRRPVWPSAPRPTPLIKNERTRWIATIVSAVIIGTCVLKKWPLKPLSTSQMKMMFATATVIGSLTAFDLYQGVYEKTSYLFTPLIAIARSDKFFLSKYSMNTRNWFVLLTSTAPTLIPAASLIAESVSRVAQLVRNR